MGLDINFYENKADQIPIIYLCKDEYYIVEGIIKDDERHLLSKEDKETIIDKLDFSIYNHKYLHYFLTHFKDVWLEVN